jgi:small-conductance mechanosensitive channel
MKNTRNIIMASILTMFILVSLIAFTQVLGNSKDTACAKTLSTIPKENSENKDSRFKELEKEKVQQIEEVNNTFVKAENIVPGIKAQWEEVVNERHDLFKLLITKASDPNINRALLDGNEKEFKNVTDGSMELAWNNFSKAVKAENKDEIRDTFNKFLALNKEINELLRVNLNNM